jgi:hypothetical protein
VFVLCCYFDPVNPPPPQPGAVPVLTKPVTAELGNITPYIIVPGPWSERDIEYHATNVASGLAQNTGHNCISAEVSMCRDACRLLYVRLNAFKCIVAGHF